MVKKVNQKELLSLGEQKLKECKIEDAYHKAKLLLKYILNQTSEQLIADSFETVNKENENKYQEKLQEIIEGKPVQYIVHQQEFMGLNFYVDEHVLIPQPDTEILVETAIEMIKKTSKATTNLSHSKTILTNKYGENSNSVKVLDLCTGSGCVGISIAKYANVQVVLSDISKQALEVARKNAKQNSVEEKVEYVCSNLFEKIEKESFDYIVSNPPYIETNTIVSLPKEVQNEPHLALGGGVDGLTFYRTILEKAHYYIKRDGYLLLEIGYQQSEKIISLWKNINSQLNLITKEAIKDFGGNNRVIVFQKMR